MQKTSFLESPRVFKLVGGGPRILSLPTQVEVELGRIMAQFQSGDSDISFLWEIPGPLQKIVEKCLDTYNTDYISS